MCALQFPQGSTGVLENHGPNPATCATKSTGFRKWLIYTTDSAPKEAQELFSAAMEHHVSPSEKSDWETCGFLKPAKQNFSASNVQEVLDGHFNMLKQMLDQERASEWDWELYRAGFIVITDANWRKNGVTAVHCDKDRGKWKVLQCNKITVAKLWLLESVRELDQDFGDLLDLFDGSGNDGPDNQGGPAPIGEWQFAVYCTASSDVAVLQQEAESAIPDPRSDVSYHEGDECLFFLPQELSPDAVNQDWPLAYATLSRDPDDSPTVCKRHPSLFVHVRGDLSGIEIVKMEWDHDISRSDEELRRIGRESRTTIQRCAADSLVSTLEHLAEDS